MPDHSLGGLDEVFIDVMNMQRMREFYMGVLGFEEEFNHQDTMVGLQTGGAALVLNASGTGVAYKARVGGPLRRQGLEHRRPRGGRIPFTSKSPAPLRNATTRL